MKHSGVKGMKWGVITKGSSINRISRGKNQTNSSGTTYASLSKEDTARYTQMLGPSLMGKLLKVNGDRVLTMKATKNLKVMPKDKTIDTFNDIYTKNSSVKRALDNSAYGKDYITSKDPKIRKQQTAFAMSAMLGDNKSKITNKLIVDSFKKQGADVIPDLHDIFMGMSKNPILILNDKSYSITKETMISKEMYKKAKTYVKTMSDLPISKHI